MAKKSVSRKGSVTASSSKILKSSGKSSGKKSQSRSAVKTVTKKGSIKAKSSKSRVSYKQEYIKLLQKTNKTLTKEVRAIRKAIEHPDYKKEPVFEAFPKDEPIAAPVKDPTSIEEEILATLKDIELQVRSRDMIFEDLVSGSPKLVGGGMNG